MADPAAYMQTHFAELGKLESDFRNKNLNNLVASKLRGKSLLDIGCGVGHILYLAHKKGMDVYGAEPDKKLIDISKKIYKTDMKIKEAGALDIHLFKKTFDTITMIDVLEHIEHDEEVLAYLKDYISPSGQLFIVVPAYQFLYGPRDKEIGHFRRYTSQELAEKLEQNGYEIEELGYWNMIGVFVYFVISKILKKKTAMNFRTKKKNSPVNSLVNSALDWWVRIIENNINLGFGLSVICRARVKK